MSTLTYALFKYRQQLHYQGPKQVMRRNCAKLTLTDNLIKKTASKQDKCTLEDMLAINRETMFLEKLKCQIKEWHKLKKSQQKQKQVIRVVPKVSTTSLTLKLWRTLMVCLKKTGFW